MTHEDEKHVQTDLAVEVKVKPSLRKPLQNWNSLGRFWGVGENWGGIEGFWGYWGVLGG